MIQMRNLVRNVARNVARNLGKVLMVALATQVGMGKAEAHAPVGFPLPSHGSSLFLPHHSTLFVPPHGFKTLNKNSSNIVYSQYPGASGATRTWLVNVKSNIFANFNIGKTLGQQLFTGGTVTSGVLSGTVYVSFGGNTYFRAGQVIDAIGSNANNTGSFFHPFNGSQANVLNFAGTNGITPLPQGPFKVSQILGVHLTGSQSAYFSQYAGAGRGGLNAGITKGPSLSNIAGGEFTGLTYSRFFGNTYIRATNSLFAFGNDPLNTNVGPSTITLSSNPISFFTYPSGVTKFLSAGQQSYTLYQNFGFGPTSFGAHIKSFGTDSLITTHPFFYTAPSFPSPSYFTLGGAKFHF